MYRMLEAMIRHANLHILIIIIIIIQVSGHALRCTGIFLGYKRKCSSQHDQYAMGDSTIKPGYIWPYLLSHSLITTYYNVHNVQ